MVPAVMYGRGYDAVSLEVPQKDLDKALKEAGESTLVYLNVDGQAHPTIIHDVSRDHVDDHVIHADFYKVRLDEKIKSMIPVQFKGESPAVKNEGGIFIRNMNEIEVEALPQNLPHEIEINISKLEKFGDHITVGDIKIDDVKILADPEQIIALVKEPLSEEEIQKSLTGETGDVSEVKIGVEKEKEEAAEEGEEKPETEIESAK